MSPEHLLNRPSGPLDEPITLILYHGAGFKNCWQVSTEPDRSCSAGSWSLRRTTRPRLPQFADVARHLLCDAFDPCSLERYRAQRTVLFSDLGRPTLAGPQPRRPPQDNEGAWALVNLHQLRNGDASGCVRRFHSQSAASHVQAQCPGSHGLLRFPRTRPCVRRHGCPHLRGEHRRSDLCSLQHTARLDWYLTSISTQALLVPGSKHEASTHPRTL